MFIRTTRHDAIVTALKKRIDDDDQLIRKLTNERNELRERNERIGLTNIQFVTKNRTLKEKLAPFARVRGAKGRFVAKGGVA